MEFSEWGVTRQDVFGLMAISILQPGDLLECRKLFKTVYFAPERSKIGSFLKNKLASLEATLV